MLVSSIQPFECKRGTKPFGKNAAVRPVGSSACDTVSFTRNIVDYPDAKEMQIIVNGMNDKEKTQMLLRVDSQGRIPLHYTLNPCPSYKDSEDKTKVLLEAAPDDETRRKMLLQTDKYNSNALTDAVRCGSTETVKMLLEAAPDDETRQKMLSQKNSNGENIFMLTVAFNEDKFAAEKN